MYLRFKSGRNQINQRQISNTYSGEYMEKKCGKCGKIKPLEDFANNRCKHDGKCGRCKECTASERLRLMTEEKKQKHSEQGKRYYINNKDKVSQKHKEYYENNLDKELARRRKYNSEHKEYMQRYRQENKPRLRQIQNAHERKKFQEDPLFRFIKYTRNFILGSLRRYNPGLDRKRKRTEEILGCTIREFRAYLEAQFLPGMSWENRSEWHVDHIVPISWATTLEEAEKLNHYTNFQPLWAKDNIHKGNKIA